MTSTSHNSPSETSLLDPSPSPPEHHRIAIVGSGFSGLGSAIRLKQRGEHDFVLLERADRLGGTWRDNSYPGCACDVPSHLYSFSFALNPDWTRLCSPQAEIQTYLERVAAEHEIPSHIRFGHEMLESLPAGDEAAARRALLERRAARARPRQGTAADAHPRARRRKEPRTSGS